MTALKVIVVLLLQAIISNATHKADLLNACSMNDMKCIQDMTQKFMEKASKGIPDYGVKPIDPFPIDRLEYDLDDFGCSHRVTDLVIVGLKNVQISEFQVDQVKNTVTLVLHIPVTADGDISVDYNVKPKPKTVTGHCSAEFELLATTRYPYSLKKGHDGLIHYDMGNECTTFVIQGKPKYSLSKDFTDAISADRQLSEDWSNILATTEADFVRVLVKQLVDIVVPALMHNLRQVAEVLPVTAFFKDESNNC